MNILVLNCGSSSIKADVLDPKTGIRNLKIRVERLGTDACQLKVADRIENLGNCTIAFALQAVLKCVTVEIDAIGHRVVHGGTRFTEPTHLTPEVISSIQMMTDLAPVHIPYNLKGIEMAGEYFPEKMQVAVFDTAFHATLPRRAQAYAIPSSLSQKLGIRRHGFHGLSHRWASQQVAQICGEPLENLRLITCHLGNGASVTAVEYGRSIETSMGMSPLEGIVMGTRGGDLDPGVVLKIMREEGWSVDEMDRFLNKECGLKGLSGLSNDMRDIMDQAAQGDDDCRMAINVFVHRLKKYIGAYAAIMGGVDALVFTGGIGENSAVIRSRVCQNLGFLGLRLDDFANQLGLQEATVKNISQARSRCQIFAVRADEERIIAMDTAALVQEKDQVSNLKTIPIAVSARHVHLTQEAVEVLFGDGAELTVYKTISQPGQFAAEQKVDLIGPKRTIEGVRIIGPIRPACQVEISRTDEYTLGIDAPVRNSGDVANSPGIRLRGPKGEIVLEQGVICARRHIHMTPEDAKDFGVSHKDVVEVSIENAERSLTFGEVLVRVSSKSVLEMHIDTDEANAAEIVPGSEGVLNISTQSAFLNRRHIE